MYWSKKGLPDKPGRPKDKYTLIRPFRLGPSVADPSG